ncbi:MAG: DASS family sodium-coupled anion symporter [Bacteroidota bacterium]|nr:DASS family sodium-coupled anion symporter [Bacteroidota bacterium]
MVSFLFDTPTGMSDNGFRLLGVIVWMAIWWISEVVPIAVTALLPIVLFPSCEIMSIQETGANYGHKYIFLFIGGFIIANAIQKWNLHQRIALNIILRLGSSTDKIILGFMIATGFLSMWISNTATTVMMLPIALSVISQIKDHPESKENEQQLFGKALMLAVAYSASAGGIATLIGTPPNLIFAGFIEDNLNTEISFFQWFKVGLPISVSLIVIIWIYLTQIAFKLPKKGFTGGKKEVQKLLFEMGPMKNEEKKIMLIFLVTILCWISRKYIITPFIPHFDDSMIAITSAIFLFIIPSKNNRKPLLEWNEAVKIPWGILILFGGGLSIANGFQTTQIDLWIGDQLSSITITNALIVLLLVISSVNFITEMSSNMATTAMLLPIMIPLSEVIGVHPYLLLVSTTLAASCAFMLPVATPPNAVVFGSKLLTIRDMVKAGFLINVISIIIILIVVNYGLPLFWNL